MDSVVVLRRDRVGIDLLGHLATPCTGLAHSGLHVGSERFVAWMGRPEEKHPHAALRGRVEICENLDKDHGVRIKDGSRGILESTRLIGFPCCVDRQPNEFSSVVHSRHGGGDLQKEAGKIWLRVERTRIVAVSEKSVEAREVGGAVHGRSRRAQACLAGQQLRLGLEHGAPRDATRTPRQDKQQQQQPAVQRRGTRYTGLP